MHKVKSCGQREKEEEMRRVPRVQPEAMANTKCIVFLDVGRMPAASRVSIQSRMVNYCSTIKGAILLYRYGIRNI